MENPTHETRKQRLWNWKRLTVRLLKLAGLINWMAGPPRSVKGVVLQHFRLRLRNWKRFTVRLLKLAGVINWVAEQARSVKGVMQHFKLPSVPSLKAFVETWAVTDVAGRENQSQIFTPSAMDPLNSVDPLNRYARDSNLCTHASCAEQEAPTKTYNNKGQLTDNNNWLASSGSALTRCPRLRDEARCIPYIVPTDAPARILLFFARCAICGEKFAGKQLKRHEQEKHGEYFKCVEPGCYKKFTCGEDLRRHSRDLRHAIPMLFRPSFYDPDFPLASAASLSGSSSDVSISTLESSDWSEAPERPEGSAAPSSAGVYPH